MTFDWKEKAPITHIHGGPGIKIHTAEDPGHEVRVIDGYWTLGAINDLQLRLSRLEGMEQVAQEAIDGVRKDELDELQSKVDEFVECVVNLDPYNWSSDQKAFFITKLQKLGLMPVGGQGGAAHPDPDPIPVEKRTTDEILADQRELYPGKTCACCWWYEKIVRNPDTKMPNDCSTFLILPERPGCRSWKHHEEK